MLNRKSSCRNPFSPRKRVSALRLILALLLVAAVLTLAGLLVGLSPMGPLTVRAGGQGLQIYDRHGTLLFQGLDQNSGVRSHVPLSDIPLRLQQATIATEDAGFYTNPGVEPKAILRAVVQMLRGEGTSGGSTITQQLVRLTLMSPEERQERSLTRKLREALLALRLTRTYSKDQILETYLNETYYGNLAYGVEAAAQAYFGKHVRDLDLAECALLAGLPQAPARYNPLADIHAAQARQAVVLGLMVKRGYITPAEAEQAKAEPLSFAGSGLAGLPQPPSSAFRRAPHFVAYVLALLEEQYGADVVRSNLVVTTTLDADLQAIAQGIVQRRLAELQAQDAHNAALVALDPATGEILAMVGSADYFDPTIAGAMNVATSPRQPGSALKPFAYAAAFAAANRPGDPSAVWTPATVVYDVRTAYVLGDNQSYVPYNYDGLFHGPVSLRTALASSYNLPAVKVLEHVGLPAMLDLLHAAGITTLQDPAEHYGLSLTLGGGEVKLLDLTAAYAMFASGGYRREPVAIKEQVEQGSRGAGVQGRMLPGSSAPLPPCSVLDPRVAYMITDILSDNDARMPGFGEFSALRLDRPAAAKTGTTADYRDNWTVGYTPELVVGVWVGNAENTPMRQISGVSGAAPIWHDFMEEALKGQPACDFVEPPGLVRREVCADSGLLPNDACPRRRTELFIPGTEPQQTCDWHQRLRVDIRTGEPATAETPPEFTVERIVTRYPPELAEWARGQGLETGYEGRGISKTANQQVNKSQIADLLTCDLLTPDPQSVLALSPSLPREYQRLEVSAVVGGPVAWVELLADGVPIARLTQAPYRALWPLALGEHTFQAIAYDAAGQATASQVVKVQVEE
jgi:penicillin-binding protein 1C